MKVSKGIRSMDTLKTAKWITIQEACVYACKSMNTLKSLILVGRIYGTKRGGEWIIDRESIDAFYNQERDDLRLQLADLRRA